MNVKKHIAMALITGVIGMAMISGGTVAYFTSSVGSENKINSGILQLEIDEEIGKENFNFTTTNIQPTDTFEHTFHMKNESTVEIGELKLISKYKSYKSGDEKKEETYFGSQIEILDIKVNNSQVTNLIGKTLDDINSEEYVLNKDIDPNIENIVVYVEFEFKDGENQNKFQDNILDLDWEFIATQKLD